MRSILWPWSAVRVGPGKASQERHANALYRSQQVDPWDNGFAIGSALFRGETAVPGAATARIVHHCCPSGCNRKNRAGLTPVQGAVNAPPNTNAWGRGLPGRPTRVLRKMNAKAFQQGSGQFTSSTPAYRYQGGRRGQGVSIPRRATSGRRVQAASERPVQPREQGSKERGGDNRRANLRA